MTNQTFLFTFIPVIAGILLGLISIFFLHKTYTLKTVIYKFLLNTVNKFLSSNLVSYIKTWILSLLIVIFIICYSLFTYILLIEDECNSAALIICFTSILYWMLAIVHTEDIDIKLLDTIKYSLNNKITTLCLISIVCLLMLFFNLIIKLTMTIHNEEYEVLWYLYRIFPSVFPTQYVIHILFQLAKIYPYYEYTKDKGRVRVYPYEKPNLSFLAVKCSVYSILLIPLGFYVSHVYVLPLMSENLNNVSVKFNTCIEKIIQDYVDYKTPYSIKIRKYYILHNKNVSILNKSSVFGIKLKSLDFITYSNLDCRIRGKIRDSMLIEKLKTLDMAKQAFTRESIRNNTIIDKLIYGLNKQDFYIITQYINSLSTRTKIELFRIKNSIDSLNQSRIISEYTSLPEKDRLSSIYKFVINIDMACKAEDGKSLTGTLNPKVLSDSGILDVKPKSIKTKGLDSSSSFIDKVLYYSKEKYFNDISNYPVNVSVYSARMPDNFLNTPQNGTRVIPGIEDTITTIQNNSRDLNLLNPDNIWDTGMFILNVNTEEFSRAIFYACWNQSLLGYRYIVSDATYNYRLRYPWPLRSFSRDYDQELYFVNNVLTGGLVGILSLNPDFQNTMWGLLQYDTDIRFINVRYEDMAAASINIPYEANRVNLRLLADSWENTYETNGFQRINCRSLNIRISSFGFDVFLYIADLIIEFRETNPHLIRFARTMRTRNMRLIRDITLYRYSETRHQQRTTTEMVTFMRYAQTQVERRIHLYTLISEYRSSNNTR